jgi:hypothetical protein
VLGVWSKSDVGKVRHADQLARGQARGSCQDVTQLQVVSRPPMIQQETERSRIDAEGLAAHLESRPRELIEHQRP